MSCSTRRDKRCGSGSCFTNSQRLRQSASSSCFSVFVVVIMGDMKGKRRATADGLGIRWENCKCLIAKDLEKRYRGNPEDCTKIFHYSAGRRLPRGARS